MSKDTSALDSERSLESWKRLVIKRRGEYSLRVKLAHLTNGSGCSSWPTMHMGSNERGAYYDKTGKGQRYLSDAVVDEQKNWPTPKTSMDDTPSDRRRKTPNLHCVVNTCGLPAPANPSTDGSRPESWRTPSSSDGEGGVMEMRKGCAGKYKLRDHVAIGVKSAKLNPRWVETLMGLPIGWTMPSCQYPITPQGDASQEFQLSTTGNWPTASTMDVITPTRDLTQMESKGHWGKQPRQRPDGIGFIAPNTGKLSEMVHYTSPVTIEQTNCDSSATESCLPPPSEHLELF
jgi:hypothetical protein